MKHLQKEIDALRLDNARLKAQLVALAPEGAEVPEWPVIAELWDERLASRQFPPKAQPHCRSSSLGDMCIRRLYYERIGAEKSPLETHVAGIFHVGNELEEDTKRALELMGFRIERAQETVEYYGTGPTGVGEVLLYRGHPDGILSHPHYGKRKWVLDIKSMSGMIWPALPVDPIECAAWLEKAISKPWLIKYIPQIVSYLLAYEQAGETLDGGILAFVNKDNSRIKLAFVGLTLGRAGVVVDAVNAVNRHVREKIVPPFVAEPKACELCPYCGVTCEPAIVIDRETIVDLEDPGNGLVLSSLRKWPSMKGPAKDFKDLDTVIKTRFKAMKPGKYIVPGIAEVTVKPPSESGSITVKIHPLEEE